MRGGVQLIIADLVLLLTPAIHAHRCDRTPEGNTAPKSPADNRYQLKISGSPEKYVPEEGYTITLFGQRNHGLVSVPKFTGFMLMVEAQNHQPLRIPKNPRDVTERPVGAFQLYGDTMTKFSTSCPNTVTHTSSIQKTEVQVRWTAPPPGSGCVIFRATVIEHRDLWYQDDGPLSRMLCEEVQENLDIQPEVLEHCCACDEAKYEVTFEGLWSRHTHPKDFPSNSWLTRFSDVIGASHSPSYKFWEYGGVASDGLMQVAEHGSTRTLESELKSNSGHIRTIIKARGISYPNVTGKTFAVFRVNRHHHLMSLVSMIDPSPDWIVGVSALELCLRNCSWVESKVQNLYPWDAGTDSGVTYISPDQPTYPREKIRRITSSYPNDPRSPFYDSTGTEMKPLAKLYLTRQRLYEKTCDEDSSSSFVEDCKLTEWTDWGECKPFKGDCGPGKMYRHRKLIKKPGKSCTAKLHESKSCVGNYCRPSAEPTEEPEDPNCETANWADWSRCMPSDETCTQGKQTRYRKVRARSHPKYCLGVPKQETRHCTLNMSPVICPKNNRGRAIYKGPQTSTCCEPREETNERTTESEYGEYGVKVEEEEEPVLTDEEPGDTKYNNHVGEEEEEEGEEEREEEGEEEEEADNNINRNNGNDKDGYAHGGSNGYSRAGDDRYGDNGGGDNDGGGRYGDNDGGDRYGDNDGGDHYGDNDGGDRYGDNDEFEEDQYSTDEPSGECAMTAWTEWTSCNATCGPGVRIRTRSLLMPPDDLQAASLKEDPDYGTYFDEDAQKEGEMPAYADPPCNMYRVLETEPCVGDPSSCEFTESEARVICALRPDAGRCRGLVLPRWHYDPRLEDCQLFEWSGCRGNKNRFLSRDECRSACHAFTEEEEQTTIEDTATEGNLKSYSQIIDKSDEPVEGTERPVRNCKFSRWSDWSECDAACGQQGHKERTRYIQIHARNGGKACSGKTRKQKKCTKKCFENGEEEEVEEEERHDSTREAKFGCKYDTWTGWTECTATCGMNAVRQRTRGIVAGDPTHCTDRLRKRQCNVGPCPH